MSRRHFFLALLAPLLLLKAKLPLLRATVPSLRKRDTLSQAEIERLLGGRPVGPEFLTQAEVEALLASMEPKPQFYPIAALSL